MAKKFGALRSEMSPAAQVRAAQRAQRMLAEMPPQALVIYNGGFASLTSLRPDRPRAWVGKAVRRNPFHRAPHHWPTPNRCNLDS